MVTIKKKVNHAEKSLYNKKAKIDFLSQFDEDSRNTYSRIFYISEPFEKQAKKDLCEFSLLDIEQILKACEPITVASSKHNGNVISSYIRWAINKGLRFGDNPLDNVRGKEWYSKFVTFTPFDLYITEDELNMIESKLNNPQDLVIPRLLFEGVGGEGCSELLNLNKKDVNFNTNEVTLYKIYKDDKETRKLTLSDKAISYIKEAIDQELYLKKNGESTGAVSPYTRLVPNNGFVIRSSMTKHLHEKEHLPANIHTVYRRLQMIAELFGKPYFNSTNIQRSGMIKMGSDLLNKNSKLEREEYDIICERFDVQKVINGGKKEEYNYYPLKDFLNIEVINQFYP